MAVNKNHKVLRRMKISTPPVIDRNQLDKLVIDTVLKALYNNADIDAQNLERDIYRPNGIKLPHKEAERLWSVMMATSWISPVAGFGNSGKVVLSREGYQLMAQYGGYIEYLASISASQQQQTIIMPFPVEKDAKATPPSAEEGKNKQSAQKDGNDKPVN